MRIIGETTRRVVQNPPEIYQTPKNYQSENIPPPVYQPQNERYEDYQPDYYDDDYEPPINRRPPGGSIYDGDESTMPLFNDVTYETNY